MSEYYNIKKQTSKARLLPIKAGDVVGSLTIYRDGVQWCNVDLVASEDVERGGLLRSCQKLWQLIW